MSRIANSLKPPRHCRASARLLSLTTYHHCVAARHLRVTPCWGQGWHWAGRLHQCGRAQAYRETGFVLRVGENCPERDGAGAFIYGNVGKLQRALPGRPDHFPLPVEPCYWRCLYAGYLGFDGLLESHKVVAWCVVDINRVELLR